MSLLRACGCGRRLRGVTPGALTIFVDGQPLDAAIVLCGRCAIDVRRVLAELRQHAAVAQQARQLDLSRSPTGPLTLTQAVQAGQLQPVDTEAFERESHGRWPVDQTHQFRAVPQAQTEQLPAVEQAKPRRNLRGMRQAWRT